jgi:predicted Zn-dependent protease with MMP-like domain
MTPDRFDELVVRALDTVPPELARHMDNVVVQVEEASADANLLGLYHGIPLTERGQGYVMALPDQITIFRGPILARCVDEDAVVEEVRITVVHEIAHHFGIDDERLHELGYG